ncbi:MAG: pyridoxal phosphate-dependent aminotransferase [Chloroflexota bacterium]
MDRIINPTARALPQVGSRAVEDRIHARRAVGGEVLALRGAPSLPWPDHVRAAAVTALDEPDRRPSRGLPELSDAIATILELETGWRPDPEREILITNGAMQAIGIICRSVLDRGDTVIIPTPNFYLEGPVRLAGGEPVYVPCCEEDEWRWDLDRIERSIDSRTRIVFACNPGNPTGIVPTRNELQALLDLAERHGFLVLADESYERFVYGDARLTPALSLPRSDHLVVVRSLSKSYAFTSWRVGYIIAPPLLSDAFVKVLEWECLHCAYIPQRAAAAVLTGPQDWLSGVVAEYERHRDLVYAVVTASPLLSCTRPDAGPFLFLNTGRLEQRHSASSVDVLLEQGVPTVPGEFFGTPGYVRLPFGGEPATINMLCSILQTL